MKFGPVTKLERNKKTFKKLILANYDVIVIFPIFSEFGVMQKPDSGQIVCKTYIFINNNLLSCKTENRIKKSLKQLQHYCFE